MTEQAVPIRTTAARRLRFWAWLDNPAVANLILVLILVVGAYLRLSHVNWDMETHIHPDERFLTMVTEKLALPSSLGEYFDSTKSPLNPYNVRDGAGNMQFPLYVYGNLPLTIVRAVAEVANQFNQATHQWTSEGQPLDLTVYWGVHYVGRTVSGLFDLGGVLMIYLIARRLYGRRAGLLSALFLAFAVLPLQQSHFFTADTFATFFSLVTFYFAVRVAFGAGREWAQAEGEPGAAAREGLAGLVRPGTGGWPSYLALGASLGATLACRINLAPLALIALLAIGMRAWREWSDEHRSQSEAGGSHREGDWLGFLAQATLFRVFLFGIVAVLAFRIFMPYAFGGTTVLDFSFSEHWRDNMREIQQLIAGDADYPPGHQWTGRTPFVFPFVNMVVWGMGLPLGLAGWAGFAVAFWQIARSLTRAEYVPLARRHLLPAAWAGGMFFWQGLQFVQSMRYLLPIYPIVGMFAAWLLCWLVDRALAAQAMQRPTWLRLPRVQLPALSPAVLAGSAYALLSLVTIGTLLWGWGFLAIYRRPLTRVTASRWIYNNIPAGAHLANEHWDDQLPLGIDGRCGYQPCGPYKGLSSSSDGLMQMYGEDTPEKREELYRWLDEADYIVLSSNRLWASIPRLPTRYPMSTRYYQLLFEGKLGFQQVLKVTSFPTIFGIQFDDSGAEEAFSVYDHPIVYIFQKTPDYSEARLRAYFDPIDLENTIQMWPKQASKAPTGLLMTAVESARQRAGGTWSALFDENGLVNRVPVLVWLVLLELLGLAGFALLFDLVPGLSDRGYAFAKTFGILALAWLSWIGPALKVLPFSRGTIAVALLLLLAAGAALAWRRRGALAAFWRSRRSLILVEEGLFLALLAIFLLIRWANPDLWHPARGGEKPMDLAYLNAVIRSTTFPPYDPWFAGGFINYYYFGFVIVGALVKLTGIVPWVAYNLAVPALFALTGLGAFGVAYNLAAGDTAGTPEGGPDDPSFRPEPPGLHGRALLAGVAGLAFVAIAGNLGEVKLLFEQFASHSALDFRSTIPGLAGLVRTLAGAAGWLTHSGPAAQVMQQIPNDWWFWNASRVIPETINEFPFFTFVYADLHAHMIAFPLALLALGAAVALVRGVAPALRRAGAGQGPWTIGLAEVGLLALLGFVIGALRATNTWDFPTYLLVALAALVALEPLRRVGPLGERRLLPIRGGSDGDDAESHPIDWAARAARAGEVAAGETGRPLPAPGALSPAPAAATAASAAGGVAISANGHAPALAAALTPYQARLAGLFQAAVSVVWRLLLVAAVSAVAFYPYTRSYATAYTGLQPWRDTTTGIPDFLVVHGFFLALILIYLVGELDIQVQSGRLADWFDAALPFIMAAVVVLAGGGWIIKARVWLIAGPLLVLTLLLACGRALPPARRLALLLIALGLAIVMGVEVIRLQDDIGRMNTVFKFYLQAWILFGVAAAFGLPSWLARAREWTPAWRRLAQVVAVVLFAGVMLYPLLAARAKILDRFSAEDRPHGLDGMAYMDRAHFFDANPDLNPDRQAPDLNLAADKAAMLWMLHNVQGSPVILEGITPNYRWGSRFSIYTGLPAVMGWDWHEKQQRSIVPGVVIDRRIAQVRELYTTPDLGRAEHLLATYHVEYVIVGELERAYYGPQVGAKFDALAQQGRMSVVYDQAGVRIYQVAR